MSKAFTREDDDAPEAEVSRWDRPRVPPGVRNLVTPDGLKAWQDELALLTGDEEGNGADAAKAVDTKDRIQQLRAYLRSAVPTAPPSTEDDRVRFGAEVTVQNPGGEQTRYRIVGVDEVDLDRNWVSWLSPVAKALLQRQVGDQVRLKLPGGETLLTLVGFEYHR